MSRNLVETLRNTASMYGGNYKGTTFSNHDGERSDTPFLRFIWDDQDDCDLFLEDERVCENLEYSTGDFVNGIFESCLRMKVDPSGRDINPTYRNDSLDYEGEGEDF